MRAPCFSRRVRGRNPLENAGQEEIESFLNGACHIVKSTALMPLVSPYDAVKFDVINEVVVEAHQAAAAALGRPGLFQFRRTVLDDNCYADDAFRYISDRRQPTLDRFSLLECLIQSIYAAHGNFLRPIDDQVGSLLQEWELKLTFRNLKFEPSDGPAVEATIHDPFWDLLSATKWDNVRTDMQTALAQRDSGGPNPALYASRAFESALKIVADDKGWLSGREFGASQVIDTFVSQKNGRFLEVWEGEAFRRFFADVRNPDAHGAGSKQQPKLSASQTNWAIEFCMISIKSLLSR